MSKYPAQIDTIVTLPLVADNSSSVAGETVNRLRNAIVAIEQELGVQPSGVYSTVRNRLDTLDSAIANLEISGLDGDVTGGLSTTKVEGFGGRPFSDQQPELNQVISWNGIAWVPSSQTSVILNVLPTTVVLPADINFLVGDTSSTLSTPIRIGARTLNTRFYPATYPDGRFRTLIFKADIEVTNAATVGSVQLKDMTHNVIIENSVLTTSSTIPVEVSAIIYSGTIDGYIREDVDDSIYELQLFLTGGTGGDQVICKNARVEVTYSPPILVSALVPLALPTDIEFVVGMELNGTTTPLAIGGRTLDMTKFTQTLPDGRVRVVNFTVSVEASAFGVDGYIQLIDTTHGGVLIVGTKRRFSNTDTIEYTIQINVGTENGMIRTDVITRYEVQMWRFTGSVSDRVICNNARISISYS